MESNEKKGCSYNDSVHPDGSRVCCEGYCLVCKDGRWVDTSVNQASY